ncbi:leucyl/phenylalanyl-tRNA--protein transferase [Nitrosomonas sp. Nm51]|uniref:leucyl/phenylalanyl-tRNA--protein transferase n=1 Tax=Nitrosomonas sp. Nm51 TaxID=133720 RepID=UPI0008C622BD|nr:leucyl/phenylalanyl-tRNA--protein transferase [Nitrosomonas sp. Nm51]SER18571.1 leucyl/phenylalanyl-tRNA--protein transferase [Nitrosomonas sp. Nm51]
MVHLISPDSSFPPLEEALSEPNGLLAVGGDLSPKRLIDAYQSGIFPWFNEDEPVLWWSPDPRMVLFPNELKVSRSLRKSIKKNNYHVRGDSHFSEVMQACAAPRRNQSGTWIHPEMVSAYTVLHEIGLAHSVETWINGELAGGLYGLAMGKVFFGESMFSRTPDASKIAFVYLVRQLMYWNYVLIDCQVRTAHLASLGAREIPRAEFSQILSTWAEKKASVEKWDFSHMDE